MANFYSQVQLEIMSSSFFLPNLATVSVATYSVPFKPVTQ